MKAIHVSGKRKKAIARATLVPGTGNIRINNVKLDLVSSEFYRMKMMEPLIIAGDEIAKKVDINVNVHGGGICSQAESSRLVIAKALSKFDSHLEKTFMSYDRQMLIADVRRKEVRKPGRHGKARAKRQFSKR